MSSPRRIILKIIRTLQNSSNLQESFANESLSKCHKSHGRRDREKSAVKTVQMRFNKGQSVAKLSVKPTYSDQSTFISTFLELFYRIS